MHYRFSIILYTPLDGLHYMAVEYSFKDWKIQIQHDNKLNTNMQVLVSRELGFLQVFHFPPANHHPTIAPNLSATAPLPLHPQDVQ